MKIKRSRLLVLFMTILFVCITGVSAYAHDVPDMDRLCSVTVTMRDGEEAVSGGKLSVYPVGQVNEDDGNYSFVPAGDFENCGESFESFEDAQLALRLEKYALDNKIEPYAEITIGEDGTAIFEDIPVGLYLVSQRQAAEGYSAIEPFLVSLPYMEDGVYEYDLQTLPKTELEPEPVEPPDEPDEPDKPDDPNLPQTGQLWWPVPILLCCGLISAVIGVLLNRGKHTDEN